MWLPDVGAQGVSQEGQIFPPRGFSLSFHTWQIFPVNFSSSMIFFTTKLSLHAYHPHVPKSCIFDLLPHTSYSVFIAKTSRIHITLPSPNFVV